MVDVDINEVVRAISQAAGILENKVRLEILHKSGVAVLIFYEDFSFTDDFAKVLREQKDRLFDEDLITLVLKNPEVVDYDGQSEVPG